MDRDHKDHVDSLVDLEHLDLADSLDLLEVLDPADLLDLVVHLVVLEVEENLDLLDLQVCLAFFSHVTSIPAFEPLEGQFLAKSGISRVMIAEINFNTYTLP